MADESIGSGLFEDEWFVHNTLPYIFDQLETPDLLSCSIVCKLWHELIQSPKNWKNVQFSNNCHYKINLRGLLNILKEHKTKQLKILKGCCIDKVPLFPETEINLENQTLKNLEIRQCPSMLCETFLHVAKKLESIKIEMMYGAIFEPSIDLISDMSHLRELRLSHSTKHICVRIFQIEFRHLRVLYFLNAEAMNLDKEFRYLKPNKLEVLALGNVQLIKAGIFSILKVSPALKKLRLESCSRWNPNTFYRAISQMKNLTCLELLDFKIVTDFECGSRLSRNIEELTIMPGLDRFYMGAFNARIFLAAREMGKTLKKFTLGFSKKYLDLVKYRVEQGNVVPFPFVFGIEDQRDPLSESSSLIRMVELEAHLATFMPYTKVRVTELDCLGNIFK